jgi:formate hydrogenlyase transcriptional activator
MSAELFDGSSARSWPYDEVASLPAPATVEDHFLFALRRLTATLDVAGVCEAVLSGVENVFGATSSWILLHDPAARVLRSALFRGRGADLYAGSETPDHLGIAGLVFTRGEIQFIPDAGGDDRWFNPERVRASGLRSVICLPLVGEKTLGVLGLDSPRFGPDRPPTAVDIRRLEVFAAQAAVGLVNARLYADSQQDRARLRNLLRERRELRQQVHELKGEIRQAFSFGPIVGESVPMCNLLQEIEQVAASDVAVLLLGETGTGKELLARALHERSRRASRPFVAVNCAALPEHLVESEMFGYERGAFTGAHMRKPGRFEIAHRGTLFLDEIGDLPANAQAKLLRVLQDGEVHRVGSTQGIRVDVRVIAATNQDLMTRVAQRSFRDDLFYRLSVFPIRVPPLRDRAGDLPLLARHLAEASARRLGKRVSAITDDALQMLSAYSWPGNVRELQNVIERAVILAQSGVVTSGDIRLHAAIIPTLAAAPQPAVPADHPPASTAAEPVTLAEAERGAILRALRQAEGRISGPRGAAALLGMKPTTLHAKMKKLGVQRRDVLKS